MNKQDKTGPTSVHKAGGPNRPAEPTPIAPWRQSLLQARSGAELLKQMINVHDAPVLIPQLSVDDLMICIRKIGLADADAVLALASGQQVQGLLDSDCWNRDQFEIERVDPWLGTLMAAGPDVLGRHLLAQDDSLLNLLVQASIHVIVVEEPEDFEPPDDEHVLTPDGRLCICFPASATRDLPIKIFLDWMMRTDPLLITNLLIHLPAALKTNLEEDAYRWRSGRMADRGYIDYYDALRIYVPASKAEVAKAEQVVASEGPITQHWLEVFKGTQSRLQAALAAVPSEHLEAVQSSLAVAMNMALSADRVELWDEEHQADVVERIQAGLSLALESLNGVSSTTGQDAATLVATPVSVLFRIGYGVTLEAVSRLRRTSVVRRLSGPAGRVDGVDIAELREWAEWLTARHPSMPNGAPPSSLADIKEMRNYSEILADMAKVSGESRPNHVGIGQYLLTQFASGLLGVDTNGPLPENQLLNAHALLLDAGEISGSARDAATVWWLEQGGTDRSAVSTLLNWAESELGPVPSHRLDARFQTIFWTAAEQH